MICPIPSTNLGQARYRHGLQGLLAKLRQKDLKLIHAFAKKRGAVTQDFITRGTASCTSLDNNLQELNRAEEEDRSKLREEWFGSLSVKDKKAFDAFCLALAEPILAPLFPVKISTLLRGPVARLALEWAATCRRFAGERNCMEASLVQRGLGNRTIVDSFEQGLSKDKQRAKSQLIGRWFRELTRKQGLEFDKSPLGQAEKKVAIPVHDPPRFDDWAIGLNEKKKWVLFKRFGDEFRDQGRVRISKGRQTRLLEAFLQHKGVLSRDDAVACDNVPAKAVTAARKALQGIRPELTNIRNAVRNAMKIPGSAANPFPPDGNRGWVALIQVGYAVRDQETGRVRFKTPDEMSDN